MKNSGKDAITIQMKIVRIFVSVVSVLPLILTAKL